MSKYKNSRRGGEAVAAVGALGVLAAQGAALAPAASAANVDYVANVTADKSIYDEGIETSSYTATVENQAKVDGTVPVDFTFTSPINGAYSSDWEVTCTDSMGKECKPTITPTMTDDGAGFNATLPALEAGEKVTFKIKAPTNASLQRNSNSRKDSKVVATISPTNTGDVDTRPATNKASVSPQLVTNEGDYGISVSPMINDDDPNSQILNSGTPFHVDYTLSNYGNVDEVLTVGFDFSNVLYENGKVTCATGDCSSAEIQDDRSGEWVPLKDYTIQRDSSGDFHFYKVRNVKVKAGEKTVLRLSGITAKFCNAKESNVTVKGYIFDASTPENETKEQNNYSENSTTLRSAQCKVTDLATDNITQSISTNVNGIRPYMIAKDSLEKPVLDSQGNYTYSAKGETVSFQVTYSNKGTFDEHGVYTSTPSLNFPGATMMPMTQAKTVNGITPINYDGNNFYSLVSAQGGASVEPGRTYTYSSPAFQESAQRYNTPMLNLPAGSSITIEYRYVVIQDMDACIDRTDAKITDVIFPTYNGAEESNTDNNEKSIDVHMIGVPTHTCEVPPGRYDLTSSVEGMYSDAAMTTPVSGTLKLGQHVWLKSRYVETGDSTVDVPNVGIGSSMSLYDNGFIQEAPRVGDAKIIASSRPDITLDKGEYGSLSSKNWKPGDYIEIAQEYIIPNTSCKVSPEDGMVSVGTDIRGESTVPNLREVSDLNNSQTVGTVIQLPTCSSTLSVQKDAVTERLGADGKGKFTITLANTGQGTLNIAELRDTLPQFTRAIKVTGIETTGGATAPNADSFQLNKIVDEKGNITDYTQGGDNLPITQVSWGSMDKPAMPAGSTVTIHMDVDVNDTFAGEFNRASLKADSDDPGNFNLAEDDAYIPGALGQKLSITKKPDVTNPKPGEKVTYTVDIANYGAPVTKAYLRDAIDAELLKDNPQGYTNVTCRPLTEADGVLTGRDAVGAAECPEIKSDASGITATITKMESNAGLRLTYTVNAPKDATSAPNTASFTSDPTVANLGDGYSQANILTRSLNVSGTVWHDADGSAKNTFTGIQTGDEKGTDGGGLTAVLVDSAGLVVNTTKVNADGTYSMDAPVTTQGLSVALVPTAQTPVKGTVFDAKAQAQLNPEWLGTTPLIHGGVDTEYKDVTNLDFGVQQPPNTDSKQVTPQENPGGTKQVQVPTLTGTDPEDGNKGAGDTFRIDTLPTTGTLYYDGKAVDKGQVITNYDPTKLTVDPKAGNVTIVFHVSAQDKAGAWDPTPGTITMPFTTTPASITGYVYEDLNKDGVKQADEKGIPGATVTLTGTDEDGNKVELTTNSDANGFYQFVNLVPGAYSVKETQPANYKDGKDSLGTGATKAGNNDTNDVFADITLSAGDKAGNYNFGEEHINIPGTISGNVYEDKNNDGVKGVGENPIPGTTLTLTGTDVDGNPVNLTTTTDENGNYTFKDVPPGKDYTITETQPDGYLDGKVAPGTAGGTSGVNVIKGISLGENGSSTGNNFGELKPVSIAGTVYDDANKDGKQNNGEKGIPNTEVKLTGVDKDGKQVNLTTTTDENGNYSFKNLVPGKYTVTETQPQGWDDGKDSLGTGATDAGTLSNDKATDVVLNSGDSAAGYNFAENAPTPPQEKPASISGTVYDDANKNGKRDAGEKGIPNATVTLTGKDKNGKDVNLTVITDKDGHYSFKGLTPGTYSVTETQPQGWEDGKDSLGTGVSKPGTLGNDKVTEIAVAAGESGVDYNFGENKAKKPPVTPGDKPASLSGYVFNDVNKNGKRDAGEKGVAGVTVKLTGVDKDGKSVARTATTDATGKYTFNGLKAGDYSVSEVQPQGWSDGKDSLGTGATKAGSLGNDSMAHVILSPGDNAVAYNYGENKVEMPSKPSTPPSKPGKPATPPSKPSKPVTPGPVIQTDMVNGATGAGLGALAGLGVMGGAAAALRRRRK